MSAGSSEVLVLGGDTADLMAKLRALEAQLKKTETSAKSVATAGTQAAKGFDFANASRNVLDFSRGFEDFMSQIHLGFGPAMRGANNNISVMAQNMAGPLAGGIISMGVVLGTVLIPKLFGTKEEAKDTTDHLKHMKAALEGAEKTIAKFRGTEGAIKESATRAVEDAGLQQAEADIGVASSARDKAKTALAKQMEEDKRESDQDRTFFGANSPEFVAREAERARKRRPLEASAAMAQGGVDRAIAARDAFKSTIAKAQSIRAFEGMKARAKPEVEKLKNMFSDTYSPEETDTVAKRKAEEKIGDIDRQIRGVKQEAGYKKLNKKQQGQVDALETERSKQQDIIASEREGLDAAKKQRDDTNKLLKTIADALTNPTGAAERIKGAIPGLNRQAGT